LLRVLTIAHNAVAASNRARTDALRRIEGVDAQLLTPPWWFEEGRRIRAEGSQHWRVGRTLFTGNGTRHVYAAGLIEALRAFEPDVLDLYEEPFSMVALQATVARQLLAPRAALVLYSAVNVARRWRRPYRAAERFVLARADGAYVPNADVPGILRTKGMRPEAPIAVIPLGVDVDRFASAKAMQLVDIPAPRIGFVGRFEPVKGLPVLLDAFSKLTNTASLVLVGDGSQRELLRGQRVHVLPPIDNEELPSFLKALSVLVLPSVTILPDHREQFGRILVEGMASGVPVIGSTSGAIPSVIGDAGLVVPERDAVSLARAIDRLLDRPDLADELVARGLARARSRFAWCRIAGDTVDLFRAAVHMRRAGIAAA
jgi:glycosyltransferase involved in cell wall biosynthesis